MYYVTGRSLLHFFFFFFAAARALLLSGTFVPRCWNAKMLSKQAKKTTAVLKIRKKRRGRKPGKELLYDSDGKFTYELGLCPSSRGLKLTGAFLKKKFADIRAGHMQILVTPCHLPFSSFDLFYPSC